MFVDSAVITFSAGKGGNGVVAWRREKFVPKGGPAGGNGGKGGSIRLRADSHLPSLESFRNKRKISAENGLAGSGNNRQGRDGKDLLIKVPCGTLLKDAITHEVLFDFTQEGDEHLLCKGGKGGKGNTTFKSPTHQAPNICTPGLDGESCSVELELKLIADIGLIGMPNAGKSTLLNALTDIPVKIGAYPFTTLSPNLGYIQYPDYSRILLADIPGLIELAHLDKGLGHAFLKHIERSSALLFVIDISGFEGRDPFDDYQILLNELSCYRKDLLDKPFFLILNKLDREESEANVAAFRKRCPVSSERIFEVSALSGAGIDTLKQAISLINSSTSAI